ncbi:NAD(P)/FAD-dependent oxidoreductase [Candidatus Micrarchaeota archaeon]|nr:MAG: NAD(P)/FAD-dependent oxidoreductase [Candidatus Micrarchaeota archaeon]
MQIPEQVDVVVVGAGPGGSRAAREAASLGLKTVVFEKRQEVGAPVRCGEGLGEAWMRINDIKLDRSWAKQEMHGAVVYSPSGKKIVIPTENKGWIIDRKVFDKQMAIDAGRAGARIFVKSTVYEVIKEGDIVKGVRVRTPYGSFDVEAKVVIAADGVESQTARSAGINTVNNAHEVDSGFQYEMVNIKFEHPDMIHLYFGNEIAPRGYVWIFPKGDDIANVGIGIIGQHEKTAKEFLDAFIEGHPEMFGEAAIVEMNGGCIPVGAPLSKPYMSGLMVIGDAAHMVNPIHGGGMGTSMEAGIIAARTAKKAIDAGDVSEKFLKQFYDEWMEKRGKQLLQVLKVRRFFEKLSDSDLEKLADMVTPELLLDIADGRKAKTFIKIISKAPKIAMLAAKELL